MKEPGITHKNQGKHFIFFDPKGRRITDKKYRRAFAS